MTDQDKSLAERRFAKRAAQMLDRSARHIDAADQAALDRARAAATAAVPGRASTLWVPIATAAGVATLAALLAWNGLREPDGIPIVAADDTNSDMEIVLADEQFEMLEDLEFYAWLTEQRDAG